MRIDSHKLMFHPRRVAAWMDWQKIPPLYVEVSPSGACNHRCLFCALDFLGYKRRFLDLARMRTVFQEMAEFGVKSVMFGGEGEPMLHPQFAELVRAASTAGLDVGITTNASMLTRDMADSILPCITWLKASVDAGTKTTYGKLHGVKNGMFETVMGNLEYMARARAALRPKVAATTRPGGQAQDLGVSPTLGIQMLWLPENRFEVHLLAEAAREIGLDYLVVKPYSQHPSSATRLYANLDYSDWEVDDHDPFVIWRLNAIEKWSSHRRDYDACLALPFWCYIDSGGTIWGCSAHIGEDAFRYGNINESHFKDIWTNCMQAYTAEDCRIGCRMDECNKYLRELRNPKSHVNFI